MNGSVGHARWKTRSRHRKKTAGRQDRSGVKLGCVFTQAGWDEEGFAVRDPASTTYTGAIETAQDFGKRLYRENWNRGRSRAKTSTASALPSPT